MSAHRADTLRLGRTGALCRSLRLQGHRKRAADILRDPAARVEGAVHVATQRANCHIQPQPHHSSEPGTVERFGYGLVSGPILVGDDLNVGMLGNLFEQVELTLELQEPGAEVTLQDGIVDRLDQGTEPLFQVLEVPLDFIELRTGRLQKEGLVPLGPQAMLMGPRQVRIRHVAPRCLCAGTRRCVVGH
jgi:hypothetical protein